MPQVGSEYLERRRNEILAAAHRCFARGGFRDTTMQEIAREAGLSVGALYRYFDGRESLIDALAELGRAYRDEAVEAVEPGSGAAGLGDLVSRLLAQLPAGAGQTDALRFDVRIWGEAIGHPRLERLVVEAFSDLRASVTRYVRAEQEAKTMGRGVDAEAVALGVVSLLAGLELQLAFEPGLDREAYAAVVGRLLSSLDGGGASLAAG